MKRPVLIAVADGVYKAIIASPLNTGFASEELLALDWEHCSLTERRIRMTRTNWQGLTRASKSGGPLDRVALYTLKQLRGAPPGLVFCNAEKNAMQYRQAKWAIEQICKKSIGEKRLGIIRFLRISSSVGCLDDGAPSA